MYVGSVDYPTGWIFVPTRKDKTKRASSGNHLYYSRGTTHFEFPRPIRHDGSRVNMGRNYQVQMERRCDAEGVKHLMLHWLRISDGPRPQYG